MWARFRASLCLGTHVVSGFDKVRSKYSVYTRNSCNCSRTHHKYTHTHCTCIVGIWGHPSISREIAHIKQHGRCPKSEMLWRYYVGECASIGMRTHIQRVNNSGYLCWNCRSLEMWGHGTNQRVQCRPAVWLIESFHIAYDYISLNKCGDACIPIACMDMSECIGIQTHTHTLLIGDIFTLMFGCCHTYFPNILIEIGISLIEC